MHYIYRKLRRNWQTTVVVVAILSGVLGWNGVVLMLLDSALFRTLNEAVTSRIVSVVAEGAGRAQRERPTNFPVLVELRTRARSLEQTAGYFTSTAAVTGLGPEQYLQIAGVTDGFLALLEFRPEIGRGFLPGEYSNGSDNVAVVSHRMWITLLKGRPDNLGHTVVVDGKTRSVIGVMKPDWRYPFPLVEQPPDIMIPLPIPSELGDDRGSYLGILAKLHPASSLEAASAEAGSIFQSYSNARAGSTKN